MARLVEAVHAIQGQSHCCRLVHLEIRYRPIVGTVAMSASLIFQPRKHSRHGRQNERIDRRRWLRSRPVQRKTRFARGKRKEKPNWLADPIKRLALGER